ncbi:MAG: type II secretion system protein GspC [Gammaproteobacteria bacterium]|nr:type II secretion system protein GspC [Gammaproteobacteria bacterium]|tara:strand:- start:1584 stop:2498 length:915 start_codon:yes stop_codon:yes gene_type:complete
MISRVNFLNSSSTALVNLNRLLPPIISLLLVLLIVWQLSNLIWSLIPNENSKMSFKTTELLAQPSNNTQNSFDINQIAITHLFGVSNEKDTNPISFVAPNNNLADTKLVNLVLNGTVASDISNYSIAIISNNGNNQKVYTIGDSVGSNAVLYGIYSDRVILNENGALTNLKLPREFKDKLFSTTLKSRNISRAGISNERSIQSTVTKNLTKLTDVIRPAPYRVNGKQIGFRVYPGRDRQKFISLGFKPGDIIKEIDGKSLSDISQAMQVFQSLDSTELVEIKIDRNGQTESLTLKTDQLDLNKK